MSNLVWYAAALLLWLLGRRQGRDEGRTEAYGRAAEIFAAGVTRGNRNGAES